MTNANFNSSSRPTANSTLLGDAGNKQSSNNENWREAFPEIIGRSNPMLRVLETISKVARSDSAVLIHGESGTGKELVASALHRLSPRSNKKFIALNCSAIPENLLESELFGHEKGAFTGAVSRRAGHFELAAGGTLFLDEIGDMPMRLQAKLLRVLQERQYTLLGGTELKSADVRIVAATNVDLEKAVGNGSFRLDLYYRLNVLPIRMPRLSERRSDVPQLLDNFLDIANRVHDRQNPCFLSPEAIDALSNYSWPGNVRELQNLIERLVVMCGGGEICLQQLPPEIIRQAGHQPIELPNANNSEDFIARGHLTGVASRGQATVPVPGESSPVTYPKNFGELPMQGLDLPSFIETLENSLITQALERTQHNKNQAARLLGLNRTTLVERIKKRRIAPLNAPSKEL